MSGIYTISEVKQMVHALSTIFDIVRVVDPIKRNTMLFDDNDNITYEEYTCHQVWNKQNRCENCISLKTLRTHSRMTKFEFVNEDVYHVVAKYIVILDKEDQKQEAVLEIVSKITDEIFFGAFGKGEIINRVLDTEKKIYLDSLTKVYNRRYYDERIFCNNSKCELTNRVVFILTDLKEFKLVNDNYGHDVGDWALEQAALIMRDSIRQFDSVIRIGGDEFLIILNNCTKDVANRVILDIKKRWMQSAIYDKENHKFVEGNFGIACTEQFDGTEKCIINLLKQADIAMYQDKCNME